MFIFDASGSMRTAVGNDTRIGIAKKAMETALKDIPKDVRLGLMMYGHRRANDCTDIEMVSPVGADDAASISKSIQAVQAKGETPIDQALRQAARNFAAFKGQSNSIVLVTDGIEECKGDPCAAARDIKALGIDLKLHVIGFTLNDAQRKAIQCVPDITGGKYFEAKDAGGLNRALGEVRQQAAQAPPPPVSTAIKPPEPSDNLLSPAAGGRLVMAPAADWANLADGKPDRITLYSGEAVWAFKDGKPATFDAIEFLVPAADQYNIKDVELFIGDEGPTGTFTSVGTLVVQNMKSMSSPYQRFTLPSTTARFVKISVKSDWGGGYAAGYEIKLKGKIDEAAASSPKLGPAVGIDLIAPTNGGILVIGRNEEWEKLTNGKPLATHIATYDGEGIWSFKDGKPATFDRIEVLVEATYKYNLKNFEVLAGDEGPTGAFRSLGKFTTVNARMHESPYQPFILPKTTAKFVKVVFMSDWGGGYISGRGLKLYGVVDEAAAAASSSPPTAGIDLISPANGGALLAASSDAWKKLTAGTRERFTLYAGEGVWAFKDEKAATINAVEVLIPAWESYSLKEFEILVADDGPTGPFKPLGAFTTVNGRFTANNQFQRFALPPTSAKYVKIVFKSDWGGGHIEGYGLRVMGTP